MKNSWIIELPQEEKIKARSIQQRVEKILSKKKRALQAATDDDDDEQIVQNDEYDNQRKESDELLQQSETQEGQPKKIKLNIETLLGWRMIGGQKFYEVKLENSYIPESKVPESFKEEIKRLENQDNFRRVVCLTDEQAQILKQLNIGEIERADPLMDQGQILSGFDECMFQTVIYVYDLYKRDLPFESFKSKIIYEGESCDDHFFKEIDQTNSNNYSVMIWPRSYNLILIIFCRLAKLDDMLFNIAFHSYKRMIQIKTSCRKLSPQLSEFQKMAAQLDFLIRLIEENCRINPLLKQAEKRFEAEFGDPEAHHHQKIQIDQSRPPAQLKGLETLQVFLQNISAKGLKQGLFKVLKEIAQF